MRRSLLSRVGAALVSVWFTVVTLETAVLHSCPMHDGSASARHGTPSAHAHGGHAPFVAAATPDDFAPPTSAHHECTCPGACCATTSLAALADRPQLTTRVVAFDDPPVASSSGCVVDAVRTHLRPPAIGPPPALA